MTATTAENLLERFDAGEDVLDCFDIEHPERGFPATGSAEQIELVLPTSLLDSLGQEASRRGVARDALISTVLVDWVEDQHAKTARMGSTAA